MSHLIRFVQPVGFSSRSMNLQSQENEGLLQDEIKEMMKVIGEWQADLLLLDIHNLKGFIENHVELIHKALNMIPKVKIIAINTNAEQNNESITQINNNWQEAVDLPNLIILQEFETIFLDELGLIIHGGSVFSEKEFSYLPKLAVLDNRWPNLLVLPENYLFSHTDKGKIRLGAFDYTTIHPWLDEKRDQWGEQSDLLSVKTASGKGSSKSLYIKGLIKKDCVSWEISPSYENKK